MPVINVVQPASGVAPEEGPCSWLIDTGCCADWETLDPVARSNGIAWSTYILWALTGRQYGPCPVDWRPCSPKCAGAGGYRTWPVGLSATGNVGTWMFPYIDAGVWRNCVCPGSCTCGARCEVPLPGPVAAIDQVKVDGAVIDPSAYRMDTVRGQQYLVRIDGDCWPQCQDINRAATEVGTFLVTYQRGIAVPRAGQIAAGLLACEFAKACQGAACALPDQLLSLSRNGVEVAVADPTDLLNAGLTGIEQVDLWIRSVNPARKAQPSRVWSPDAMRGRFTG